MVRPDVIGRKVGRAAAWLDDAETVYARPLEEFARDVRARDLATFYLFLAIQECIDIATHWIADAGWPAPDEAAGAFDVLAERGAIDGDLVDALRAASGLRNRIAHGYATVDHARVHQDAHQGLPALRRFLVAVARAAGISPDDP